MERCDLTWWEFRTRLIGLLSTDSRLSRHFRPADLEVPGE